MCAKAARSDRITAGSAPASYCARRRREGAPGRRPASPARTDRSTRARSARPSMSRTVSARDGSRAVGDRLVEKRQAIAHRAFRRAGDRGQRFRPRLDSPRRADAGEVRDERIRLDAAQVEALAARQDRDRHLADLGRGENELGVRRRLLERLQEGVERLVREHVDFVDDVDLVAGARGCREVKAVLALGPSRSWRVPVVRTEASKGQGSTSSSRPSTPTGATFARRGRWPSAARATCAPRCSGSPRRACDAARGPRQQRPGVGESAGSRRAQGNRPRQRRAGVARKNGRWLRQGSPRKPRARSRRVPAPPT